MKLTTFQELAQYFDKLESITSRNTMTEVLAQLFKDARESDIGKICYLLQGRVAPLYEPLEFGMADKMVVRAVATAVDTTAADVTRVFKREGDLGKATELLKDPHHQHIAAKQPSLLSLTKKSRSGQITIIEVYETLLHLAQSSGAGSQEKKITTLSDLIAHVDPLSARFIVRIVLGKLRLGFSDMTILDALSWMLTQSKEHKKELERAYNVRPDLAFIAAAVKTKGIKGVAQTTPQPGTPIMMARANRLSSAADILAKIGKCAVEYKYDGLRLQVHYDKAAKKLKLFSRNLEEITVMFPDIAAAVRKQISVKNIIFEGEVVAYNPKTGVFVPFQETMQRKRKYDIAAKAAEIPVKLFAFECLYKDGKSYLAAPYSERKAALKAALTGKDLIIYAQETIITKEDEIEKLFADAVEKHFEGIIAKKLDGAYEAGIRGWNWIKYKKAMNKKLADTLDVLVMGYTKGEGKRTDFGVGQFLTGVYDKQQDKFLTVSKIGTGLSDEQFRELFARVRKLHAKEKPPLYEIDKLLTPDVWLEPQLVVEVGCDEITRSAVHTAGRVMEPSKSGKALSVKTPGFALRFPKLIRFRDDRRPEDVTTVGEVEKIFMMQKK